jgi:hypothetical protein
MLLIEASDTNYINLTTEWMSEMYTEMNRQLFNNELGACNFKIFKTGKGANGNVLGWFKMTGTNLKYSKQTRRIYQYDPYWGDKIYVDRSNFVDMCKPTIELNGNYKWSEKAALSTLVHEMCHYYCNMYGFVPIQSHGTDFKEIAAYVSSKSNGIFTVERLAKAEQMNEMELDSAIAAKNRQRQQNKLSKIQLVFVFRNDGTVRLINSTSPNLTTEIINIEKKGGKTKEIKLSTDENLKNIVFDSGYKTACRAYRYWPVEGQQFVKEIDKYQTTTIPINSADYTTISKPVTEPKKDIIPVFRFKTAQGRQFLVRNVTKEELISLLKECFPKWSDEVIQRIISNKEYYK